MAMQLTVKSGITLTDSGSTVCATIAGDYSTGTFVDTFPNRNAGSVLVPVSGGTTVAVPTGNVTIDGSHAAWVQIKNKDATNSIKVYFESGTPTHLIATIPPGGSYGPDLVNFVPYMVSSAAATIKADCVVVAA